MIKSDIVCAEALDMTIAEVRRRWPSAVEYTALDGDPCWRREDLAAAADESGNDEEGRQ